MVDKYCCCLLNQSWPGIVVDVRVLESFGEPAGPGYVSIGVSQAGCVTAGRCDSSTFLTL